MHARLSLSPNDIRHQVVHVTIAAQMDLNTSIPASLVDWAVRRCVSLLAF